MKVIIAGLSTLLTVMLLSSGAACAEPCDSHSVEHIAHLVNLPVEAQMNLATSSHKLSLCVRAQIFNYLLEKDPAFFLKNNLFFKFLDLENKLGLNKEAVTDYLSWPWEMNPNPWAVINSDEEPAVRLLVLKIFANTIPQNADTCLPNPWTGRCDEGQSLENYDKVFMRDFPNSRLKNEIALAVRPYYLYYKNRSMRKIEQLIKNASGTILFAKTDEVAQVKYLNKIVYAILNITAVLHPEDQTETQALLNEYSLKLKNIIAANPRLKSLVFPEVLRLL